MSTLTKIRATVATATIAATLFAPSVAQAGDGDNLRTGSCSKAADWKLKLSPQNGRIEVEYEIDANRRGQQWRVTLFHNGRRVMRDVFTTRGPSGSFTVRRVEADRRGDDRIRARGVRVGDGQRCGGAARF